jgi:hypothetical protein
VLGPVLAAANKLVLRAPANRAALYLLLFFHAIMRRQPVFEVTTRRTYVFVNTADQFEQKATKCVSCIYDKTFYFMIYEVIFVGNRIGLL